LRKVDLVAGDKAQGEEGWNYECDCEGKIVLAPRQLPNAPRQEGYLAPEAIVSAGVH
jgi:hypothetical protein